MLRCVTHVTLFSIHQSQPLDSRIGFLVQRVVLAFSASTPRARCCLALFTRSRLFTHTHFHLPLPFTPTPIYLTLLLTYTTI
ncbi:hypothetical protein GMOD_00004318 [Pyrenophora seminiperda CCB06]|uniref:Uncharacterized protein n=1 Tax=Pyrenophora seminiperda CCB06 TaxID=1302712 RepID=A0A3M7M129_9PLEO|nr:hypothetical protein GMOD_00004318 [Pyrenophora seminiperda CCB06]